MNLTRENYYDFGAGSDDIIVSNSSLAHINPDEGGSIKRFLNYIRGKTEKEESKSLERGRILHRFLEDSETFVMSPEDSPSEDVCRILQIIRTEITTAGVTPGELRHHEDLIVQVARSQKFGASNWSSDTLIKKIRAKGDAYFDHLNSSDGKIMTDAKTRAILEAITDGLKTDDYTRENYIETPPGVMKELPILFQMYGFDCKSLLDNAFLDFDTKSGKIRDVKTTSKPVSTYVSRQILKAPESFGHAPTWSTDYGPFVWYHTYRQLAFYGLALKSWLTQKGELGHKYHIDYEVLACETVEPYEHRVFKIHPYWIKLGESEIEKCFSILKSEFSYGNETLNNSAVRQSV